MDNQRTRLKERWEKLKRDMAPMTKKEKLEHLWEYYKWVLVVLAVVVVLVWVTISSYKTANQKTLIHGVLINTDISLDGYKYLTDDFRNSRTDLVEDEAADLSSIAFHDPYLTTEIEYAYNAIQKFEVELAIQNLDYYITDMVGLDHCVAAQEAFFDLSEILSEEELAFFAEHDDLIYWEEEDGTRVPVAINMRNMAYSKLYMQSTCDIYFGFISNTVRLDACRSLWAYMQSLEA